MLWRRYRERDRRPGDAEISKEAFCLLTEGERRRGVEDIFDHADHIIINDKNREDFRREIIDFGEAELGLMRVSDAVNEWEIEARLRYR